MNLARALLRALRSKLMHWWFRLSVDLRGAGYIYERYGPWARRIGGVHVLRALGAKVGERVHLEAGIRIQNAANGRCENLVIQDDVYVGPEVLIDLAGFVLLETQATIAGRVSIITHMNVGPGSLKEAFPPASKGVAICRGSFVGFGTIVTDGVTIGAKSVVGAGSVVTRSIPANSVAFGVPARVVRSVVDTKHVEAF